MGTVDDIERWVDALLAGEEGGPPPFDGRLAVERAPEKTVITLSVWRLRRLIGAIVASLGLVPAAVAVVVGTPYFVWMWIGLGAIVLALYGALTTRQVAWIGVEPSRVVVNAPGIEPFSVDKSLLASVLLRDLTARPDPKLPGSTRLVACFRLRDERLLRILSDVPDPRFALASARVIERVVGLAPSPAPEGLSTRRSRPVPWPTVAFVAISCILIGAFSLVLGAPLASLVVTNAETDTELELTRAARVELRSTVRYFPHVEETTPELRYDVVVLEGGSSVAALSCDPFANRRWLWHEGDRTFTDAFQVVLPGCALDLEAGRYTLRASRVWLGSEAESNISETTLAAY